MSGSGIDTMTHLDELRSFSARAGADPLLVQGPGGNTSIKTGDVMWVKASGTWLRDALDKDVFVPVDWQAVRRGLAENDPACKSSVAFVRNELNALKLRPSIETTVHALMPQPVVVHVHCVNTISWAIREDAESVLAERLEGQDWAFIPYVRPGLPLANGIAGRLRPGTDILVLGNHGLAVAAESVSGAARKLDMVVNLLRRPARPAPAPNLAALAETAKGTAYRPAADPETHALAMDPQVLAIGGDAVLYPDHAVFLGVGVADRVESDAPLVALPGQGVLVRESAAPAVEPMGRCLADVLRRNGPRERIRRLTPDEIGALLNWDAEKYRQRLTRR